MRDDEATELIRGPHFEDRTLTWADLGCGDGTFTRALASLLPPGSIVHAIDRDTAALRQLPRTVGDTAIHTHAADFTAMPWPFDAVDGLLLANSLHYVRDQAAFIDACAAQMSRRRFVIVEYDMDRPNRWVPYPLSRASLARLFRDAGYRSIEFLCTRPSVYQRAQIYSAVIERTSQAP